MAITHELHIYISLTLIVCITTAGVKKDDTLTFHVNLYIARPDIAMNQHRFDIVLKWSQESGNNLLEEILCNGIEVGVRSSNAVHPSNI